MQPATIATSESEENVRKAKDALKILQLERQIIGSALTTIFESESKGIISAVERVRLVDKYKMDLKQLEEKIKQHQRVVDLNELENSRQELVKSFNLRMSEIDEKMRCLKDGNLSTQPQADDPPPPTQPAKANSIVNDAEKRVEQIRDEILKAMDRLEQIESDV
jgi:Mg2+ and Co2+ transporter CorA